MGATDPAPGRHAPAARVARADQAGCSESGTAEPIHAPRSIQRHGALLVVDPGDLAVVQASANLAAVLGLEAASALGRPAPEVLGQDGWRRIEPMLHGPLATPGGIPPRLATRGASAATPAVAVAAGRAPCGRYFIELEPRQEERLAQAATDPARLVPLAQSILASLRMARTTLQLGQAAARELRRITGHDRVMMYRFHRGGEGEVVAEERAPWLEPFLGLHYPAADIPPEARRLYLAQRQRIIVDVDAAPMPMLGLEGRAGPPLDMTHCTLRAAAPIHLEYMRNMGVRATLALSLIGKDGTLWGMLVGHSVRPHPVPAELRVVTDLVARVVSVLLGSLGDGEALTEQLARERHLRGLATALADPNRSITEGLEAAGEALLGAAEATGVAARIGGRFVVMGAAPARERAEALLDDLAAATARGDACGLLASEKVAAEAPAAADLAATAAGALLLPLPHGTGDAILWLRPEIATTVAWAGNPNAVVERDVLTGRLSPRRSFAVWREEVRGHSAAWTETDLAAAREVRRLVGDAFLRRTEAELARLRHSDPLTGLPNRRLMQERLETVERHGQGSAATAALIYVDLDRFKDVNDTLGHEAGDSLLVQIGARLRAAMDERSLVARIGGDEFAILCEGISASEAEALAERMRAVLEPPFELVGRPYRATASVGVAHSCATGLIGSALLQAADVAMYEAKRGGGNGSAPYAERLRAEAARRFALEQDLRSVLDPGGTDGGGLLLHLQPIVALEDGRLVGFEALARWLHPRRGLIPPGEFVPIAESAGLIGALGDWVLEAALDAVAGWPGPAQGASPGTPWPYVTVNVSSRQLVQAGGLAARIAAGLEARRVLPSMLRIEVTESAMADVVASRELMALRDAGIAVAIDDFGTGYSSLSYLAQLPADMVKLDRSFLPGVPAATEVSHLADPRCPASAEGFMAAIVALAREAGLEVIAEGVETPGQLAALSRAGVRQAQGFLLARPMPVEAAADLMRRLAAGEPPPWAPVIGPLVRVAQADVLPKPVADLTFLGIVQALDDAVIVTDAWLDEAGPRTVYVNEACERLTGYRAGELIGRSPRMLQGPETDRTVTAEIRRALRGGLAVDARVINHRRDGTQYLSDMRIVPVGDGHGTITHFVALLRGSPEAGAQRARALPLPALGARSLRPAWTPARSMADLETA